MQCLKYQEHGHIASNCDNAQGCQRCGDTTTSRTAAKMNLSAQIALKGAALHIQDVKKATKQNNKHALRYMQKLSKEGAQKMAIDAHTKFEKNLKSIPSSLFSKFENKIEQNKNCK